MFDGPGQAPILPNLEPFTGKPCAAVSNTLAPKFGVQLKDDGPSAGVVTQVSKLEAGFSLNDLASIVNYVVLEPSLQVLEVF